MAHLDPADFDSRPEHFALREHLARQLHHTHHMLLAAGLAAMTIVVVAAAIMLPLF
jgi:hypothetical protein